LSFLFIDYSAGLKKSGDLNEIALLPSSSASAAAEKEAKEEGQPSSSLSSLLSSSVLSSGSPSDPTFSNSDTLVRVRVAKVQNEQAEKSRVAERINEIRKMEEETRKKVVTKAVEAMAEVVPPPVVVAVKAQPEPVVVDAVEAEPKEAEYGPVDPLAVAVPSTPSSSLTTPDASTLTSSSSTTTSTSTSTWEQIKKNGVSGTIAYVLTEVAFWTVSIPLLVTFYHSQTGEWLNFSIEEERVKIIGVSGSFFAFARLCVPVRAALAFALVPTVQQLRGEKEGGEEEESKDELK